MTDELKDALSRIETETHNILAAAKSQNDQNRLAIARLDEIIALLTPKDNAGEPTLSELLAHLIAQGREQLILTRKAVDLLIDMQQNLPSKTVEALETHFSALAKA
ncbi:hypothetical protein [Methylocystis sp.]|uniref:hypothetical protein n=1 Tax=Methylocystis sp. TaxID=1911079 RepID=UPI0025EA3E3B|nr:hypothetical protein [Methylocystis sp.]